MGKFHCSKGGQKDKLINKCKCEFYYCSTPILQGEEYICIIKANKSLNSKHTNHQPNPRIYLHSFINDELKTQIQTLSDSGIKQSKIQKYLLT